MGPRLLGTTYAQAFAYFTRNRDATLFRALVRIHITRLFDRVVL